MSSRTRLASWIVSNAAFAAFLYYGFEVGINGARNVALFYAWFGFFGSLMTLNDAFRETMRKAGPPAFPALDALFDAGVICFLVWHGVVATSVAYTVHTLLLHGAYASSDAPAAQDMGEAEG